MNNFKDTALLFKAFCDENRLLILNELKTGEKCACTLLETVPVGQSTLSHHMKILIESTIVTSRREGKWTYYKLSDQGSQQAIESLEKILEKSEINSSCQVCSK